MTTLLPHSARLMQVLAWCGRPADPMLVLMSLCDRGNTEIRGFLSEDSWRTLRNAIGPFDQKFCDEWAKRTTTMSADPFARAYEAAQRLGSNIVGLPHLLLAFANPSHFAEGNRLLIDSGVLFAAVEQSIKAPATI